MATTFDKLAEIGEKQLLNSRQNKRETMCPRCGNSMQYPLAKNHISRYAPVFICENCWFDETPIPGCQNQYILPMPKWWCIENRIKM